MNCLKARACAKLNLSLDVCAARDDGYHELSMLMQSVDLTDDVEVALTNDGTITVDCGELSGEENIAYVAAKRYLDACSSRFGANIKITKRIPVCAGLAGGSADAAAVLSILNRMIGEVKQDKLMEIAVSIGADVPFAMHGGLAFVRGVGEKIEPIGCLPECSIVLAKAGVKDSTGKMFTRLDKLDKIFHPNCIETIQLIKRGDLQGAAGTFANSFDALWTEGLAGDVRQVMKHCGALGCAVSGSGPTIFGVFSDDDAALLCIRQLSLVTECWLCHPTDKSIYFE